MRRKLKNRRGWIVHGILQEKRLDTTQDLAANPVASLRRAKAAGPAQPNP